MGEMLILACIYSPVAIIFGVLAYYWNFLHKLKKTDNDIQCFASRESFYPLNDY
jgi:hypothetical protein